jgi:hypothetical protein
MKKIFLVFVVVFIGLVAYYYFPEKSLPEGEKIDKLEIYKERRELIAYSGEHALKTYTVSLKSGTSSPTYAEEDDDKRMDKGSYVIVHKDPRSRYYRNLGFSPAGEVIQGGMKKPKSGRFSIHGMRRGYGFIGKFHRWRDWTKGGVALTDEEIDELFSRVELGTVVIVHL